MLTPLNTDQFNYQLPAHHIATHPATPRSASKLLVCDANQNIQNHQFTDLPTLLPAQSVLVFNDTKVIPARLIFYKPNGVSIQVFCLEPHKPTEIAQAMQQPHQAQWLCMIGNAKRWKDEILTLKTENHTLTVQKITKTDGGFIVDFQYDTPTFADALQTFGNMPLPPYIHRPATTADTHSYQTIYAAHQGAVAAPTAGLHFTPDILHQLSQKNIDQLHATLHVGAGTFKPMQPHEPVQNHTMHAEQICVTLDFLMALQKNILENKKIIAVGTTAVRTLESLYHLGLMTAAGTPPDFLGQWQAYQPQQPPTTTAAALQHLIHHLQSNQQNQLIAHTQIMIVPGFKFNICDAIITNFHQPQSTLLCLVAAFVGSKNSNTWQNIYTHALQNNYRFLSYGDSSLLYKST